MTAVVPPPPPPDAAASCRRRSRYRRRRTAATAAAAGAAAARRAAAAVEPPPLVDRRARRTAATTYCSTSSTSSTSSLVDVLAEVARNRSAKSDRGRVRDREGTVLADRVGLDLEVEVDTDELEERVVDRDEPDFDRHLKVLQPAKLAEQVGDLLVHFGRVLDDQADAEEERNDRTRLPLLIDAAGVAAEAAAQAVSRRSRPGRSRLAPARCPARSTS